MTPIDELLDRMTLREKVGQLNQRLQGWQCVERVDGVWRLTDVFRAELDRWGGSIGAIYGLFRADPWSGRSWTDGIRPEERAEVAEMVADAVRAASSYRIPPLLVEEAPHGHLALGGTMLPVPLNLAATWDPDLVEEAAQAVAAELAASGAHIALVSALDVLRDPRWGRCEECLGESPYLAARIAEAMVRGMQGPDRSRLGRGGVGVVLKHYAGQGGTAGGRNGQSTVIGPRDLRELHLPPAEAGVRAGAVGVMAAYNDIDGVPCCANRELLTGILREEWGFDGLVMADGHAVDRLAAVTGSLPAAARLALLSGVDLSLWDEAFTLLEQVADAEVRSAIDRACRRVLYVKHALGLLGDPQLFSVRFSHTRELSARLAARSLVLLDDNGVLPLRLAEARRILVVGPYAAEPRALLGDYSPPSADSRGIVDVLRSRMHPDARLVHVRSVRELTEFSATPDLVVAVLGGTSHRTYADEFTEVGAAGRVRSGATSGEGVDLADLRLPGDQDELLRQVRAATSAPVVAVIVAGRPHVLSQVFANSDATLWAGFPGPYGADAVLDVLTGVQSAAGRLPMTLPAAGGVIPVHHDDRHLANYVDAPEPVLRPFGFSAARPAARVREVIELRSGVLRVTLENPADEDLVDVLQVFARRPDGVSLPRQRELVGFARVTVPARTTQTVELAVREQSPSPVRPPATFFVHTAAGLESVPHGARG